MLTIRYTRQFHKDYKRLQKEDKRHLKKLKALIENIQETPFEGLGKPEALKGNMEGYWSRRISKKHRLVYTIQGEILILLCACYGHYDDR